MPISDCDLKSCPFCGATPKLIEIPVEVHYYVMCIECGACGSDLHGKQDAVDAWNNRAELQQSISVPSEPLVSREEAVKVADERAAFNRRLAQTHKIGDPIADLKFTRADEADIIAKEIRELPAVSVPVPADAAAHSCLTYAAMVESQNDVSRPVENWSDFHRGEIYAAQQLAATFASASSAPSPSEEATSLPVE